jgi:hypothetical protein
MALNELMPADAGIDTEEFNNGTRATRETVTDTASDDGEIASDEATDDRAPRAEAAPAADDGDEDARASEAAKELNKRKRGLEGRKETIQSQINALVRERGEVERDTARGRAERAALQREIDALRQMRDRAVGGDDRELGAERGRQTGDPRGFDPRRPQADDDRQPWSDQNDRRPMEGEFDDFAQYAEAVGRWGARQEVRRAEYARAQQEQLSHRQRWEAERQKNYADRYQKFAKANPTFEQEIDRDDLVLTAPMVDVIKDSDVGPQMMLHLARNPEDIDRIARLHPVLAFGEMKKLEARLEGAHSGSPQSTQHSKARPPIKPVDHASSRASESTEIPDDDVDVDEHIARMNARDEALRKRGVKRGYGLRI